MNVQEFVTEIASLRFDNVFNPYSDACGLHDIPESPFVRCQNLTGYLKAALRLGVGTAWFGRDLGYRGGRRTGLALTDEPHLPVLSHAFGGLTVQQATIGDPVGERTAGYVWKVISTLKCQPFLWNVFPLHPFEPGNQMSNRRHTAQERDLCEAMLRELLRCLKPRRLIALGADSHTALARLGYTSTYVRHPSYGGTVEFMRGIARVYGAGYSRRCAGY
jgi:hypothetical protein